MRLFYIILLLFFIISSYAQPKYEVRAAWLTTIYGLDWPSNKAINKEGVKKQKDELCTILDKLKAANFNTVLFQTRLRGDVIYNSQIEPFNESLTGKTGKKPGYDPLSFVIEECHKRGMEIHAWLVSIPLGSVKHVRDQGYLSVVKRCPSLCKLHQGEWFLDPGNPTTKDYLSSIVCEIVNRYDIDGIHLDYIRYPDRPAKFPDEETYRKYGKGRKLDAWRRNNVTEIVRKIYNDAKKIRPWVKISSSPIGKFKDTSHYSSYGWNAYNTVYQDAQGWLKEGIQDMLFPMMYFNGNHFYPFVLDWQEKRSERLIIPGLGIYFLSSSEKNWPLSEIERQIAFIRCQGLGGQAYYRTRFLMDNTKKLTDELICNYYAYPALVPPMSWQNDERPIPPIRLNMFDNGNDISLKWESFEKNSSSIHYNIYASDIYPVDVSEAKNIIAIRVRSNQYIYSYRYSKDKKKYFAVTAVDRYGNESDACQLLIKQTFLPLIVSNTEKLLLLPKDKLKKYITITDVTNRNVLTTDYSDTLSVQNLKNGYYQILVTDEQENITVLGNFIKADY